MNKEVQLQSTIKCPKCGFEKIEKMPQELCVHFYQCTQCGAQLKGQPMEDGCGCIYCIYGSEKCPPEQGGGSC